MFLLAQEHAELPVNVRHEFVPYNRGPYSFTLAYDLQALARDGAITEGETSIAIHPLGLSQANALSRQTAVSVDAVILKHGAKSTRELIDYVYAQYPWYTLNSKWINRRAVTRPTAPIRVYTTGYEGISLDGLLDRLLRAGIFRLLDVRANPVARRFGFHKSTLARLCPKVGIEYIHMPELGVPSEWRSDLNSRAAYDALFAKYNECVLSTQYEAVRTLRATIEKTPTALMCKEADPTCCHRTALALEISRLSGLPVQDLGEERDGGLF